MQAMTRDGLKEQLPAIVDLLLAFLGFSRWTTVRLETKHAGMHRLKHHVFPEFSLVAYQVHTQATHEDRVLAGKNGLAYLPNYQVRNKALQNTHKATR